MSARHAGRPNARTMHYRPGDIAAVSAFASARRAVARELGVDAEKIRYSPGCDPMDQHPNVRLAKRSALYLAVVACDRRLREVARAAGCSVSFVRMALAEMEDARDCPRIDEFLDQIAEEIRSC